MAKRSRYLSGARILPPPVGKRMTASELIERTFLAYNAGRLREGARLLSERMLEPDVTVGLSLTGALTPAGLGVSCLVPLIKAGFVDWIVSTGANLYHDAHFGLGLPMHAGSPFLDDRVLRDEGVVRIYDVLFDYEVLLDTDAFFRQVLDLPEFQAEMGTAEFHYRLGRYMAQREKTLGQGEVSVLAAAWRYGVPVYTSSPGDSSIGMNVAAMRLGGRGVTFDVSLDVNETAAIVYDAKRRGGKARSGSSAAGRRRTSCSRPSRRSRRSSGSTKRGTTTSCRSPTPGPTRAGCPARRPRRRSRGGRWTRTSFPTRWSATSTPPWRCRSFAPSRSTGWESGPAGASTTAGRRCWRTLGRRTARR